jgi:hypothetical protein
VVNVLSILRNESERDFCISPSAPLFVVYIANQLVASVFVHMIPVTIKQFSVA